MKNEALDFAVHSTCFRCHFQNMNPLPEMRSKSLISPGGTMSSSTPVLTQEVGPANLMKLFLAG